MGTLTSWKPLGHPRPVTGLLYLYLLTYDHICLNTRYESRLTDSFYVIHPVVLRQISGNLFIAAKHKKIDVFLTVHHSIDFFKLPT